MVALQRHCQATTGRQLVSPINTVSCEAAFARSRFKGSQSFRKIFSFPKDYFISFDLFHDKIQVR